MENLYIKISIDEYVYGKQSQSTKPYRNSYNWLMLALFNLARNYSLSNFDKACYDGIRNMNLDSAGENCKESTKMEKVE